MAVTTGISWTKSTYNDWFSCTEKSEACAPCYARTLVTGRMGFEWGKNAVRIFTTDAYRRQLLSWNKQAEASGQFWPVFCFSLADWADPWVDPRSDEQIAIDQDAAEQKARARGWKDAAIQRQRQLYARVDLNDRRRTFFQMVDQTTALTYQLLTKRPEQVMHMIPNHWRNPLGGWPEHVWLGITTENERTAALRLVFTLEIQRLTGCQLVFTSAEPLYSAIDYTALPRLDRKTVARMLRAEYDHEDAWVFAEHYHAIYDRLIGSSPTWNALEAGAAGWVITGGQSAGDKRRWLVDPVTHELKPEAAQWLRDIRDACARYDVAFFHKQNGGAVSKATGKQLDGVEYCNFPGNRLLAAV